MKTTTLLALVAAATLGYATPVPDQQAEAGEAAQQGEQAEAGTSEKACGGGPCGGGPGGFIGGGGGGGVVVNGAAGGSGGVAFGGGFGFGGGAIAPPPPCLDPWCAGLPPPPPHLPAWPINGFPPGSLLNNGGLQQFAGDCSQQQSALSCCNGDDNSGGLLGLLPFGPCGFDLFSDSCSQNLACCDTNGGGLLTVGGLCQLINL